MRAILSAILVSAFFASSAMAANPATSLAPGKPAGVEHAQNRGINPVVYAGLGAIAVFVLIAAGHSSHKSSSSSVTTTGTSP